MDNVVPHPTLAFQEKVAKARSVGSRHVFEWFAEAHESGFSREPLARLVQTEGEALSRHWASVNADDLLAWCSARRFIDTRPAEAPETPPSQAEPDEAALAKFHEWEERWSRSLIMQRMVASLDQMGEAADTLTDIGSESKYWFFRPAWQIDTATWAETFGDHDPAAVITFYMRAIFNEEHGRQRAAGIRTHSEIRVDFNESDKILLKWLFRNAAEHLSGSERRNPRSSSAQQVYRGLISASNLHYHLDNEGLHPGDLDFDEVVAKLPSKLATAAIERWPRWFERDGEKHDDDWVIQQARFVSATVIAHLGGEPDEFSEIAMIDGISNEAVSDLLGQLGRDAEEIPDLMLAHDDIARAVISVRDGYFGGILPVPFRNPGWDRSSLLRGDDVHWLVVLASYEPGFVSSDERFDVIPFSDEAFHYAAAGRTNSRARARLESYRRALRQMQAEHLDELATAWWAFFIATQAIAFQGLGLPPAQLKEVAEIARELLPDEGLNRAVEFALAVTHTKGGALEKRTTTDILGRLLTTGDETAPSVTNIYHLARTREGAERWLIDHLGTEIWDWLSEQSREELIVAEQRWSVVSLDLGTRITDYNMAAEPYFGVIEAELRRHVEPIANEARRARLCDDFSPTLGGYIFAVRQASERLKQMRRNSEDDLSTCVLRLAQVFRSHSYLELRNPASHRERSNPITQSEMLIIRDGLYKCAFFRYVRAAIIRGLA